MKRIITIICFFFLVVTLSAQDISSALRQAQARFDSGNETGGIELVNKVLAKYPDNKEAKDLLAKFNQVIMNREIDAAWTFAKETNSFEGYQAFRTKHPNSKYDDDASDIMAKKLADRFNVKSTYADRSKAESYARKEMTRDYIKNKWNNLTASKQSTSTSSSTSERQSYSASTSSKSSNSYNSSSSYNNNQRYNTSSSSRYSSESSNSTSYGQSKFFRVGINGYIEGLESFSSGIGLQFRMGRLSSPINFVSGIRYHHTYCKELVSYLNINDDYDHIDDYIQSGMAYYKQKVNQAVVPLILNWNFIANDELCGFFAFGYEHGFLISKKDSYKATYDEFNMNHYLMSEDYPSHTLLAYPSRNLVIKGGMGAQHWDWSIYGKVFLNNTQHSETASLGFEFTYYF